MNPKPLKIGIATAEEFRTLTRAIARGEKCRKADEPKVWFESLQSAAQVLGGENKKLLQTILDRHPASIKELEVDSRTVAAGGLGFRYRLARKLGLQSGIDIARGPEDTSIYLTVGSAW